LLSLGHENSLSLLGHNDQGNAGQLGLDTLDQFLGADRVPLLLSCCSLLEKSATYTSNASRAFSLALLAIALAATVVIPN
jgi:hypothetical protein